jgi:hypothetical protein
MMRARSRLVCLAFAVGVAASSKAHAQPPSSDDASTETDDATESSAPEVSAVDTSVASAAPEAPPVAPEIAVQPEAEAAPPPPPPPTQLGPAEIVFNGGRLSLGFVAQLRTTMANEGGRFGDGARETEGSIELRRIRLLLRGSFLDGRLTTFIQLSTSPSSLELLDVAVDGRLRPHASLRVGVFKTPFTLHRNRSYQNLSLTEWDPAAVRFGAERQIGLEVHSVPTNDEGYVDYSVGVFTGVNSRDAFARGIADVYGEVLPNPSNLRSPQPPTEIHPELFARVGYATAGAEPLTMSDARGGPVRAFCALSVAYDVQPIEYRDFALRVAAEGMVKAHHLFVNAVSYLGFFAPGGDGVAAGMLGMDVDVAYRVLPRFELAFRYARVDTLARLRDAARTRADDLVASADFPDTVAQQYAEAGQMRNTEEYAVGVNVPVIGRSLVFQMDAAIVRFDRLGTRDDDTFRLRMQVQFGF